MRVQKAGQGGDDDAACNAHRHVDTQPAAQRLRALAEHGLQFIHVGQQVLAALVEGLAVLRELHLAGGPVQQARAEHRLQLLHRHRGGRLGDAQRLRGARKAGKFSHAHKDLHGFESVGGHGEGGAIVICGQTQK